MFSHYHVVYNKNNVFPIARVKRASHFLFYWFEANHYFTDFSKEVGIHTFHLRGILWCISCSVQGSHGPWQFSSRFGISVTTANRFEWFIVGHRQLCLIDDNFQTILPQTLYAEIEKPDYSSRNIHGKVVFFHCMKVSYMCFCTSSVHSTQTAVADIRILRYPTQHPRAENF